MLLLLFRLRFWLLRRVLLLFWLGFLLRLGGRLFARFLLRLGRLFLLFWFLRLVLASESRHAES